MKPRELLKKVGEGLFAPPSIDELKQRLQRAVAANEMRLREYRQLSYVASGLNALTPEGKDAEAAATKAADAYKAGVAEIDRLEQAIVAAGEVAAQQLQNRRDTVAASRLAAHSQQKSIAVKAAKEMAEAAAALTDSYRRWVRACQREQALFPGIAGFGLAQLRDLATVEMFKAHGATVDDIKSHALRLPSLDDLMRAQQLAALSQGTPNPDRLQSLDQVISAAFDAIRDAATAGRTGRQPPADAATIAKITQATASEAA